MIPAGVQTLDSAELFESTKMVELMNLASRNYSKIIIDSSPVLATTDALMLSRVVDGVLFVIRAESTPKKQILNGLNRLNDAGSNILGLVLGRTQKTHSGYGYYYDYKHYYGKDQPKSDLLQRLANFKEKGYEATASDFIKTVKSNVSQFDHKESLKKLNQSVDGLKKMAKNAFVKRKNIKEGLTYKDIKRFNDKSEEKSKKQESVSE